MCVCCSVLQSHVAVCCSHMLLAETEEGRIECVCVAVCVAACCSHMLVAETEEGCDQYVCVAACCTHTLQRVAAICYSW